MDTNVVDRLKAEFSKPEPKAGGQSDVLRRALAPAAGVAKGVFSPMTIALGGALLMAANFQAAAQIKLPVEVMSSNGQAATSTVQVSVPPVSNLSSGTTLSLKVHGLEYETQASVQVNGSAWMPLTSQFVTGLAAQYGGIGVGLSTVDLAIPLPGDLVDAGTNTISFRFNGTDGNSSGFRVLSFGLQTASGTQLLSPSTFINDDPAAWTPPMKDAGSQAAGKNLWQTASLVQRTSNGGAYRINARCGDCHTSDGRDLKYFNYSNTSIYNRALFHGLNSTQANQIVSYIRSLSTPAPSQARPWNPPYQPGPGLDSQPVTNWSAGAGLGAVLTSDSAMQNYLAPGGDTSGWSANSVLNARQLPIALQLPDWNHWLPSIHPSDTWGVGFTSSQFNKIYLQLRSDLAPANAAAYSYALQSGDYVNWFIAQGTFLGPIEQYANWDANNLRTRVYSAALWQMVKLWELNQEFGLEGLPQIPYGSKAEPRAWYGSQPFNTSPNMLHIPAGAGLGNGSEAAQIYLSYIWYHEQLVLNDGNGQQQGQTPIDYGYVQGYMTHLNQAAGQNTPEAMLQLTWLIKALQEETEPGVGPDQGSNGWSPNYPNPEPLVDDGFKAIWGATSGATRASLSQSYVQHWLTEISSFKPSQFYAGGWANPGDDPHQLSSQTTFGGSLWYMLPRLRFYGIDPSLTYRIAAWAATVWPRGNWSANNTASCTATPDIHCSTD